MTLSFGRRLTPRAGRRLSCTSYSKLCSKEPCCWECPLPHTVRKTLPYIPVPKATGILTLCVFSGAQKSVYSFDICHINESCSAELARHWDTQVGACHAIQGHFKSCHPWLVVQSQRAGLALQWTKSSCYLRYGWLSSMIAVSKDRCVFLKSWPVMLRW